MQDVSFSIPQRKKFTLEITESGCLRARNQGSKEIEFGVPLDRIREFTLLDWTWPIELGWGGWC